MFSKRTAQAFIAGMMLTQSLAAFAQAPSSAAPKTIEKPNLPSTTIVPVVGGKQGGTFIGNAGDYNINAISQDNSAVMSQIIARTGQLQDMDRQYLENIVRGLNGKVSELISLQRRFNTLSAKSMTSTVPVEDYISLLNEIREKNSNLVADINNQAFITREMLPSYANVSAGKMDASVATSGQIDLKPLMGRIEGLRQSIVEQMSKTPFKNVLDAAQHQVVVIDALNPDLSRISIFSEKQMIEKQKEIADLLVPTRDTQNLLRRDIEITVNNNQEFVDQYGKQSYLTYETIVDSSGERKEGVKEALQKITNHFFQRSYLRKRFHQRIGTFNVAQYDKSLFRSDILTKQPIKVIDTIFKNQIVLQEADVTAAFRNATAWFRSFDEKSTGVFSTRTEGKDDKYATKDAGLFVRLNTLITNATGQQEVAEVARLIVQLLLADVREEQMAMEGDFDKVASYHDLRFRNTDAMKELTNRKMCQSDWSLPDSLYVGEGACALLKIRKPTQPNQISQTMASTFSDLLYQINFTEKDRRNRAENVRKLVNAQLEANISPEQRQQQTDEANEMFK